MSEQTQKYLVPISIVVAGLIVAGAIFMTRQTPAPAGNGNGQQAQQTDTTLAIRQVDPSKDHILGNPDAPVLIVEYSDAQCPFCRSFDKTMNQIMASYGKDSKVGWVYRNFPLDSLHPDARRRAYGLECAASIGGNDKFWSFLTTLYAISDTDNQGSPDLGAMAQKAGIDKTKLNECVTGKVFENEINADSQDAIAAGGNGTPFNVLVTKNGVNDAAKQIVAGIQQQYGPDLAYVSEDGKRIAIKGALPLTILQSILDAQLK